MQGEASSLQAPHPLSVRLVGWSASDAHLLEAWTASDAIERVTGPGSLDQSLASDSPVFKIVDEMGAALGWIGLWPRYWRAQNAYELGWGVRSEVAQEQATLDALADAIANARDGERRFVHAFPQSADVHPNEVCQALGFTLVGECEFDYGTGDELRCNDWRLDLARMQR